MAERPPFIFHWKDHLGEDKNHYPGSEEPLCYGTEITDRMGLIHIGLGVDVLPPGRRSSWPHCHEGEEEFFLIIEGTPDIWVDGELHRVGPGDCIGFAPGTGVSHTFINNTDETVVYLAVGERQKMANTRIHYPFHPKRNEEIGERHWKEAEGSALGPHDGKPDAMRKVEG